jgi:hypothetical protein
VLRGQTYVSIYSPANAHYELASDQPFATLRGEYMGDLGAAPESSRAIVLQHGNNFDADTFVPVWTSQLFVSDWLQPSPLPLAMTAARQGSGWQVTVENKTDDKLTKATAVLGGRLYVLGELPAGESKTFSLDSDKGQLLEDWARQTSQNFVNAAQSRRNSFGNNETPINDLATASMSASFLSQVSDNANPNEWQSFSGPSELDLSRYAETGYGILLAWDDGHSLTEPLNRFRVNRTHRNTLLRLVVPMNRN